MKFLLNLHYSDFWADRTHQEIPAAWQGQDLATLAATVHDYTKLVVATLDQQGTPPDIVQIGNEVSTGMLWPRGRSLSKATSAGASSPRCSGPASRARARAHRRAMRPESWCTSSRAAMRTPPSGSTTISASTASSLTCSGSRFTATGRARSAMCAKPRQPRPALRQADNGCGDGRSLDAEDQDGRANIIGPAFSLPPDYPATPEGQTFLVRDLLSVVARHPATWGSAWCIGNRPGSRGSVGHRARPPSGITRPCLIPRDGR